MLGRVFKAYDIRGIYPDLLTDQIAWQVGFGSSRFLIDDAKAAGESTPMMQNLVVGYDMRTSSPTLVNQLFAGITRQGGSVIDIGLVDTPMVYFAVNYLDCAGGVMVTASHNPPKYNGFKICKRKARPVGETTGLAEIRKHSAMVDRRNMAEADQNKIEKRDLWAAYAEHVLAFLDMNDKKIKVVIDASNGMAGTMVPKIFGPNGSNVPGLEIIEINFDNTSGEFVHEPNPLVAANLQQTRDAVISEKADLGICFDGDADRCMIVDEKGGIVGCDHLTALLAEQFLADRPGSTVVYDLRSSKAVSEQIIKLKGKPLRSRVGHVFMKAALAEHDACFGGELSGHFYFADNFCTDSGAIAMATVLSVLARKKQPMSRLISPLSRYTQSGEINFEVEEKEEALAALRDEFGPDSEHEGVIDELDGITIDCFESAGWWCNVRKSNTEPLLRLNIESRNKTLLNKMIEQISPLLGTRVEH